MPTRRTFLKSLAATSAFAGLPADSFDSPTLSQLAADPLRPQLDERPRRPYSQTPPDTPWSSENRKSLPRRSALAPAQFPGRLCLSPGAKECCESPDSKPPHQTSHRQTSSPSHLHRALLSSPPLLPAPHFAMSAPSRLPKGGVRGGPAADWRGQAIDDGKGNRRGCVEHASSTCSSPRHSIMPSILSRWRNFMNFE